MQSVVLGKKNKNQLQDGVDNNVEEIDNEQGGLLRKLLKLICPCKYKNTNEGDEDYDSIESPVDLKLERYLKIFNNKRNRKPKTYIEKDVQASEEDLYRSMKRGKTHSEVPFKRWRNKNRNRIIPIRTRKFRAGDQRLQNMNYIDDSEESNEFKEKLEIKPEFTRKNYEMCRERWDDEEDNRDLQIDRGNGETWNRPQNPYRFRRRRRYMHRPETHRVAGPWRQQRYGNRQPECRCSNAPFPQDILYLPHFDRPVRSRSRQPSQRGQEWSAEN